MYLCSRFLFLVDEFWGICRSKGMVKCVFGFIGYVGVMVLVLEEWVVNDCKWFVSIFFNVSYVNQKEEVFFELGLIKTMIGDVLLMTDSYFSNLPNENFK